MPEKISSYQGKNVFLVAATLRAETMYGQTNCYVLPEGEYGLYAMKNDEFFIVSERAARNFAF
jgi:leucyl-tRNA synthetase